MKPEKNTGKPLENAVRLIQQSILKNQPNLKDGEFTIEANKRVTVKGTRHELDLFVVRHPGTPYEASFVFECKDWKKPVSKNEVIILEAKVNAIAATRGILVAREISKDAAALIEANQRLQFHRCSESIWPLLSTEIVHTVHDPFAHTARVTPQTSSMPLPTNFVDAVCQWGNRIAPFRVIADEQLKELVRYDQQARGYLYKSEGTHWFQGLRRIEFEPGECTVGGVELAVLEIIARYFVRVAVTLPKYRFSIDGQGQVHTFELRDQDFPTGQLDIQLVLTGPFKPKA